MDLVANNIANVNTPSYQREKMMFVEYLVKPHQNSPMSFVQDYGTARDLSAGQLTKTENPLDVALSGDGYFTVETDRGPRYTRSGRFQLNADGQISTQQGFPVLSTGGQPITVPPDTSTISIATDGTISAGTQAIDTIGIVTFNDAQKMQRETGNLFSADEAPAPAPNAKVLQGMLEEANVNAVVEMTRMIEIHRAYESNQRLLQDEHDRLKQAISRLMRPTRN
jgi:flagellar basal-body rod protein FlgF